VIIRKSLYLQRSKNSTDPAYFAKPSNWSSGEFYQPVPLMPYSTNPLDFSETAFAAAKY